MSQKGMISAMDAAKLPLVGDEVLEIVQNGKNVQIKLSDLVLRGEDGKSAYDLARDKGETKSLDDWLDSLKGDKGQRGDRGFSGDTGDDGDAGKDGKDGVDGKDGKDGVDGKDAYEMLVDAGEFSGSRAEFFDFLLNRSPDTGAPVKGEKGEDGEDGTDGKDGVDGKSAYELAVEKGEERSLDEWLDSLPGVDGKDGQDGKDGTDGASAFDIAKNAGFSGSEDDFSGLLKRLGELDLDKPGTGGGTGGGTGEGGGALKPGLSSMGYVKIKVNDFRANDWELPEGWTCEKWYNDTSMRITHNMGHQPIGWYALNRTPDIPQGLPMTSMQNMQLQGDDTFILSAVMQNWTVDFFIYFPGE